MGLTKRLEWKPSRQKLLKHVFDHGGKWRGEAPEQHAEDLMKTSHELFMQAKLGATVCLHYDLDVRSAQPRHKYITVPISNGCPD